MKPIYKSILAIVYIYFAFSLHVAAFDVKSKVAKLEAQHLKHHKKHAKHHRFSKTRGAFGDALNGIKGTAATVKAWLQQKTNLNAKQIGFWAGVGLLRGFLSDWISDQIGDVLAGVINESSAVGRGIVSCSVAAFEAYTEKIDAITDDKKVDDQVLELVTAVGVSKVDDNHAIQDLDTLKVAMQRSCEKTVTPPGSTADDRKIFEIHTAVFNNACNEEIKKKGFFSGLFSSVKYESNVVAVTTGNKMDDKVNKKICDFAAKKGNAEIAGCVVNGLDFYQGTVSTWTKIKAFGKALLTAGKCLWDVEEIRNKLAIAAAKYLAMWGLGKAATVLLSIFGLTVLKWLYSLYKVLKKGWDIYKSFKEASTEEDERKKYMAYGMTIVELVKLAIEIFTRRKRAQRLARMRNRMRAIRK